MINIRLLSPNFGLFLLLVACSGLEQFLAYRTGIIAGIIIIPYNKSRSATSATSLNCVIPSRNSCVIALAHKQAQYLNMLSLHASIFIFLNYYKTTLWLGYFICLDGY